MMMAPLSSSHGRSGQRTPYLRQTSSVCGCRCPRRCRTCPASKYDAPGVLGHHQQLQLASWSGLLSLSVHAPPCPSLARARPQVQGCLVLGQEPAFSGRWGFSWAVVRVGMGGRSRACSRPTKREGRRVWGRDGECLWTLFAQPTILASIVAPQALTYRSASLACNENLFPSPQTPLVLVQLRKNPENLQIVTRLKFPISQMYSLCSCNVTLQRLLNRESNNWSSRSSGRWCTLCRRNTVQPSQNSPNFNTVPRKKQQIREVVRRVHCIYQ